MRYTKAAAGATVVVGTRVYCGLYGGKYGIVYKIHGEQSPATVGRLGAGVSYGGRAEFDVAFDNHLSKRLPECIVRGVQWEIFTEVATADEIVEMIAKANASVAAANEAERVANERRATEREAHRAAHPELIQARDKPDWSPSRVAAENIRRELKKAFPTVKFAVKKDGYDCVRVHWTDGPTVKMVQKITGKYEGYTRDGWNDDILVSDADATFADVFGSPKYVNESRDGTLEGVRHAWVNGKAVNEAGNFSCGWGPAEDVTDRWYNGPRADEIRRTWYETDLTNVELPVAEKAIA
jgi:hypothetical protein